MKTSSDSLDRWLLVPYRAKALLQGLTGVALLVATIFVTLVVHPYSRNMNIQSPVWVKPDSRWTPLYTSEESATPVGYAITLTDYSLVCRTTTQDPSAYTCSKVH
jgi:hypothetical protein